MPDRRRCEAALIALFVLTGCAETKAPGKEPAAASPEASAPAAAIDWADSERIEIVMTEFAYRPESIALRRGQSYTLAFRNVGSVRHDYAAPAFFRSVAFADRDAGRPLADADGSVEVAAGETVELALAPLQTGTFAVECTKPLHDLFGMTGSIEVH
jgi:uncharacterized cupredoxin-like copper-binding protein